jgi:hypothetical protein
MFMIMPPKEPKSQQQSQQISQSPIIQQTFRLRKTRRRENLPPGGYIFPLFSTCGPHEHHWLSGTESRTEGMCEPHPIQVLPSANSCQDKFKDVEAGDYLSRCGIFAFDRGGGFRMTRFEQLRRTYGRCCMWLTDTYYCFLSID